MASIFLTDKDTGLSIVEPLEDDIPKVFFGAALPQTKDAQSMRFRYVSRTMDISGYCETKAQGNSSMSFPKKNQTVKLYKDAACTEKMKVDFKGWGEQNKFCFKANWIDLTHARNIVSARLWGDMVKSREGYDTSPELLRTSPNQGAVDGFPVKVYADGVYQGRYTLNIPKDAWMANMDDELDTHCILCGEDYESGCFRAIAKIDGSDWTDEVHDTVPESIKTRWNAAIDFIMTSTDEEFVSGIGNFFDIESLIDYYIFGVMICNTDGFGKNQLFHTYDGQKWYATVYDMDCVFGTYFAELFPSDYPRSSFEDFDDGREGNLLYIRLENLFTDAIKERYLVLKDGALSLDNIINRFERFTDICPKDLVEEDYASTTAGGAFSAIPLQDKNNIQQIRNYIAARYSYVESYIMSLGITGNLLYRLAEETTFDGVDDYLDTGVKLFETPQDFTIICDCTMPSNNTIGIYTCQKSDNGNAENFAGTSCSRNAATNQYGFTVPTTVPSAATFKGVTADIVRFAAVYKGGIPNAMYYITSEGGSASSHSAPADNKYAYKQHSYPLQLGCTVGWYQTRANFGAITMHNFEVWDYAMTAEEAKKKLEAM